jgi:hypothetical protein
LLGVADVVDLEIDDADAEQGEGLSLQTLLHSQRHIATVRGNLRDVDLAHLALEAVDHE